MLQEVKHALQPPGARTLPEYERNTKNKKTSFKVSVLETLPPLTIYNRAGKKFPEDAYSFLHRKIFLNSLYIYQSILPGYFPNDCQATVAIYWRIYFSNRFTARKENNH